LKVLKNEISTLSGSSVSVVGDVDHRTNFCFQTKEGVRCIE